MLLRLFCALFVTTSVTYAADEVLTDKSSFAKVMALYQKTLAAAQEVPPKAGAIICLGSSHMQFWKTVKEDLAPLTIHNYGIGGSRMAHAADYFIDSFVIPFKPRAVILYEGSNDIHAGAKPDDVLVNFRRFYTKLHAALPSTRLYVLGLVPSPGKRFEKIDELRSTNELLAKECAKQSSMKFIDITEPLIGADGKPRIDCFIAGDIHLLPAGYAVWKSTIAPIVVPAEMPFEVGR